MSLKQIFDAFRWDWYGLGPWKGRAKAWILGQKKFGMGIGVVLLVVLPLVCSLPRPRPYKNKNIGYALTVPAGWKINVSADKLVLTLTKKYGSSGVSEITVAAELGNPYGQNGFDYIYYGIYPRLNYTYAEHSVRLRDEPYNRVKNGLDWGIMSFSVDHDQLYEIHATVFNEYVLTVTAKTFAKNQAAVKKDFDEIIHSLNVQHKERVNVFMDEEATGLFTHPL